MNIVFCSDPLDPKTADADYELEYRTAAGLGLPVELISLEDLLDGQAARAVRRVRKAATAEPAIYRGWMMKPEHYEQLYTALQQKNIHLINTPEQYVLCHHFPHSYSFIQEHTPESRWLDIAAVHSDINRVHDMLASFGSQPLLLKDYVKSRKHEWEEACYIPDASDRQQAEKVLRTFIERQGDGLNGGIVFREYVELEKLGAHEKSGMPLSKEYRLFFYRHRLIAAQNYWEEAAYDEERPDLSVFVAIAQRIRSSFFTMDIAKTTAGEWLIIEVGDGQVSGLQDLTDVEAFYQSFLD